MGTLYIVGTPIGNLEDVTARALNVLRSVAVVAAEDTRVTRKLLDHYNITTPFTTYFGSEMRPKIAPLLALLKDKDVAFCSDAGMPSVSDPGTDLVAAAAEAGFPVVVIPGPSSVTTALAASGFDGQQFFFAGFPPHRPTDRRKMLANLTRQRATLVFLESPHHFRDTLKDMLQAFGNRNVAVCRELTKLHEEVFRGTVQEALTHFVEPRGEFTIVVKGAPEEQEAPASPEDASALLAKLRKDGTRAQEAVDQVTQATGLRKRDVYKLWLETGE
ncbi:MAG: 16S rRNA (cytidine(1402)-2'-O)-methyltransferase [Dehalococcoidia bacterium]|nr:16S rRNA (cytidine(1402)-2'-O)-methyltransferase [Dehalococcoidia bacterium]